MLTCDRFRVGYTGQQYEHSCFDETTQSRMVLGWSNEKNDRTFIGAVAMWPGKRDYQCREMTDAERFNR